MSRTAFQLDLNQEHCDEIAGLHELRRARLNAWDTTPDDLAELEARIDAHLDALVLGGDEALAVVAAQAVAEDPASLYTQLAIACRAQKFELVAPALAVLTELCGDPSVDIRDAEFVCQTVTDALIHHAPPAWNHTLVEALTVALPHAASVLATFLGHTRLPGGADMLHRLMAEPATDLPPVLWAAARVPDVKLRLCLDRLDHPLPAVAQAAAVAALRRDPQAALAALAQRWPAPWTTLPLALSVGPSFARRLLTVATDAPTPDNLLALGLLGDPASIDVLLTHLTDDGLAEAAALGLFLISGAAIVCEASEDTDSNSDNDNFIIPLSGFALSTDLTAWSQWWHEHRARFTAGIRHRLGAPVTPVGDVHALTTLGAPRALRHWLADEFVIRHGADGGYEVEAWAHTQMRALASTRLPTMQPGAWTVHGRATSI